MVFKGASAYDQNDFFKDYLHRRNREESPNNIIEKPVFSELVGDVSNKTVLDLGCGDGRYGLELLQNGCTHFEGVEGSLNMFNEAKNNLANTVSTIHHDTLENWIYPQSKYDLVVSRLVIHYIKDINGLFEKVAGSIRNGGKFVFSVQHPVLTSSIKSASHSGQRQDWIVDKYFETGEREEPWINSTVLKYHHTIEDYFQALRHAGFMVEDLRECKPKREFFNSVSEYERRQRIPLFLLFSCTKN